jgi:formylmethanofuran dehydrogenase subunit E
MNTKAREVTIEQVGFSVRTYNCLNRVGVKTLGELADKTQEELLKVRNLGKKNLEEIMDKLKEYGLQEAVDVDAEYEEFCNNHASELEDFAGKLPRARCQDCGRELTSWQEDGENGYAVCFRCENCRKVWRFECDADGVMTGVQVIENCD